MANILNVTTDPAETQGVQGLPAMMNAEQFIVDNHQATVITESFGAVEEGFASTQSLLNLRHAFISAAANGVTVLASSGDGGSANSTKTPTKNPTTVPFPTVNWPASDPLVTSVGGTYLCTDRTTGMSIYHTDPPVNCDVSPGSPGFREKGWIDAGGGFSHVLATPGYQSTLPAGSTPNTSGMRGVPDVAFQASARTGPLVYDTAPPEHGWFVIGGTSCSSPQFAGIVAIADQIAGRPQHSRLPGNDGLGPGHLSRYTERRNARACTRDRVASRLGSQLTRAFSPAPMPSPSPSPFKPGPAASPPPSSLVLSPGSSRRSAPLACLPLGRCGRSDREAAGRPGTARPHPVSTTSSRRDGPGYCEWQAAIAI